MQKPDHARAKKLLAELLEFGPGEQMLMHALYLSGQLAIAEEQWAEALPPLVAAGARFPEEPAALVG